MILMVYKLMELDKYFEFYICVKEEVFIFFQYEFQNWFFFFNIEIYFDKDNKFFIDIFKVLVKLDDNLLIYICGFIGFIKWVKKEGLNQGWKLD